jgi:hypothetical protein
MGTAAKLIIDDPANFHLLTTDMKEAIIKAATNKVNIEAALTRKKAQVILKSNFTIRNNFTAKQIQFTQMPPGRYALSAIQSEVGITEKAAYMARQEEGGKHEAPEGKELAIPTDLARTGGARQGVVQRKRRLSQLKSQKVKGNFRRGGTHKSRQVARAAVAFTKKKLIRYGDNLFEVTSFEAVKGKVQFRIREVYGFDKPSTVTKAQPWLKPATDAVAAQGEKIFISEMKKQGL